MPSHLRVLHVAGDPMFFRGSLYENLIFGCKRGHPDARLERVLKVCHVLDINPKITCMISDSKERNDDDISWASSLSSSEKWLLHLVRALLANPDVKSRTFVNSQWEGSRRSTTWIKMHG
mmetsp:Transcript_43328/g.139231  ORF Transcript_43328/g.139231 Transcript_43328/m.139231 type:complete len:120 (+) Transcript_43328:378-737(+)